MSWPSVYGPADYDAMFADPLRTGPYLTAIRHVVRPDDVVVEIGTGVGYFAIAAAQAGARRVFAIERESAIVLGPDLARENGVADRVTFLHGDATSLTLPESGTVLLSDVRGMLPFNGDGLAAIMAARTRLLAPGARMIPRRDAVFAAPCEAPRGWRNSELTLGPVANGVSRAAVARHARMGVHRDHIEASALLASPGELFALDYATIASPHVGGEAQFEFGRDAVAHGMALWFEADLADGIGFSTAPADIKSVYGQAFAPFEHPLDARAGDRLRFHFRATHAGGDYQYLWETELRPRDAAGTTRTMRQSSLGAILVPGGLRAWVASRSPRP